MKQVAIGFLGQRLDQGQGDGGAERWQTWRPTVAICQHEELLLDRFELLHEQHMAALAETVADDIRSVSPETEVRLHVLNFRDPWDFEEVYGTLHEFRESVSIST